MTTNLRPTLFTSFEVTKTQSCQSACHPDNLKTIIWNLSLKGWMSRTFFTYMYHYSSWVPSVLPVSSWSKGKMLFGFSHNSSWHWPQAEVQDNPYFLQVQHWAVQAIVQLQCTTINKVSGAGFIVIITGINWLFSIFQPQLVASRLLSSPSHIIIW